MLGKLTLASGVKGDYAQPKTLTKESTG